MSDSSRPRPPRLAPSLVAAALALALPAAPARAGQAAPPDATPAPASASLSAALSSLVEAERAFARDAVARGVRDAFHDHFAEDGIGFRPHPEKFREVMAKRPPSPLPPPVILDWEPETAGVSAGGDLGFTSGPFRREARAEPGKAEYGFFFSVWRRSAGGTWEVVLDMGNDGPSSGPLRPRTVVPVASGVPPPAKEAAGSGPPEKVILDAEAGLSTRVAREGWGAACAATFADVARVHREGKLRVTGRDAACALAWAAGNRPAFTPIHAAVARSGDLGYDYGSYVSGAEKGYYGRVWRRLASGSWEVVADVAQPLPPPSPTPAAK